MPDPFLQKQKLLNNSEVTYSHLKYVGWDVAKYPANDYLNHKYLSSNENDYISYANEFNALIPQEYLNNGLYLRTHWADSNQTRFILLMKKNLNFNTEGKFYIVENLIKPIEDYSKTKHQYSIFDLCFVVQHKKGILLDIPYCTNYHEEIPLKYRKFIQS